MFYASNSINADISEQNNLCLILVHEGLMLRLHYAIFRAILRECENAMPLAMPEYAYLVQTNALSTAGIALSYQMSHNVAHALSQKVQNS